VIDWYSESWCTIAVGQHQLFMVINLSRRETGYLMVRPSVIHLMFYIKSFLLLKFGLHIFGCIL